MQPDVFKPVPFNEAWINHEKIDIHAIYRRPILDDVGEQVVDANGVPQWDLTGGLPVRRHLDWVKKGFEYVTLADAKSLGNKLVLKGLIEQGHDPKSFIMLRNRVVGATPWNPALYLKSQAQLDRGHADKLQRLVEQLGSEAVLEIRRLSDPHYQLPVHLRDIPPGGTVALPKPPAATRDAPARPPQRAVKLGPEVGDETPIADTCARCQAPVGEHAYGSPEIPNAIFCSQACLDASLPRAAKKSLIGRQRRKAKKTGATKVARRAAGEVPA